MYIKNIEINDVGGINELSLSFERQMNIICGPNAVGKTTILECLAHSFCQREFKLIKRRASSSSGKISISIDKEDQTPVFNRNIDVNVFEPNDSFHPSMTADEHNVIENIVKNLLSLKVTRTFTHIKLESISRDADGGFYECSKSNTDGVSIGDVKNWFINRYLFSKHDNALTDSQHYNLAHAKKFFSILNPNFSFSHVDASSYEIIINTPSGQIFYEYLSSGFKSILSILFGVTKELELRFKNEGIRTEEFNGVILIDELELHLHPEWQASIIEVLKRAFPRAQFIVTTHSPHVIQTAKPDEVIALIQEGNIVKQKFVASGKYGFQGWSIEEILFDVMGMNDTRTVVYHEAINSFQQAVIDENYNAANNAFQRLDEMLHPQNHLRKLLAFQLGGLKG